MKTIITDKYNLLPALLLLIAAACNQPSKPSFEKGLQIPPPDSSSFALSSKPCARYWWFASMIKEEDVRFNLDWLKANGFGGVEVVWVYPLNRFNKDDTTYTLRLNKISLI